jgi:hypothetical protein
VAFVRVVRGTVVAELVRNVVPRSASLALRVESWRALDGAVTRCGGFALPLEARAARLALRFVPGSSVVPRCAQFTGAFLAGGSHRSGVSGFVPGAAFGSIVSPWGAWGARVVAASWGATVRGSIVALACEIGA